LVIFLPTFNHDPHNYAVAFTSLEADIKAFSMTKVARSFLKYHRRYCRQGLVDVALPRFSVTTEVSVGNVFRNVG